MCPLIMCKYVGFVQYFMRMSVQVHSVISYYCSLSMRGKVSIYWNCVLKQPTQSVGRAHMYSSFCELINHIPSDEYFSSPLC